MKQRTKPLLGSSRAIKKHSGFTLLEVLIALIFFSLIGMVLQQVTASTVSQYLSVRQKMFASWMAENKLAELRLAKTLSAAREYKEELDYANEAWQLVSKVKKTENPDINKVEVEVFHVDANTDEKRRKLVLTGFIGRY
ncbi:MAG: general secretion pathway protein I [Pseudohongiellaceae bacterium]|jgi:general secretion pathway protein I